MAFFTRILSGRKIEELANALKAHIGDEGMKVLRDAASERGHHYYTHDLSIAEALRGVAEDLISNAGRNNEIAVGALPIDELVSAAKIKIQAQEVMGKGDAGYGLV